MSKYFVIGSCFATEMGNRMLAAGMDVCLNPFGTIFNPVSISNSIRRLASAEPFTAEECVEMGAGAGKICSFFHHTSFARRTSEEFLENANQALAQAAQEWADADTVIITFGTAWVWRHIASGRIVSNCLKRPGYEFSHELLGLDEVTAIIKELLEKYPQKRFIFTVSPIRHLWNGAHSNQISKATLLMAIDAAGAEYFPSYEILLDELRDYSWYAADKVHPSAEAVDIIWKRFSDRILSSAASDFR